MLEVASAYVNLVPSAHGFGPALSRQAGPQVNRSGALMGAGLGKSMLKGFIAIGVGLKVAQFFGDSVAEARESNKMAAATAQIIKTTGGAAKVTAKQVDALSTAISNKTGIDDETIQSSANIILTFKKIRNEGSGVAAIFDRATQAATDLSSLKGMGGIEGASVALGKALNDPVAGLTALGRKGVQFTEQQKDQVKALVATGDTLGAQKVILKEVESQVSGLAEAQVTNADKARVAYDNLKEQIGKALLPALDGLAGVFANRIAPAISGFVTNLTNGSGEAGQFGTFIRENVLPALQDFGNFLIEKVVPAVRDALGDALDSAKTAFNTVRDAIRENRPQLEQLWAAFKKVAAVILTKVIPFMIRLQASALPLLGKAIALIIAAAGFWVNAFNRVKSIVQTVGNVVSGAVKFFQQLKEGAQRVVGNLVSFMKGVPGKIKSAIGNLGHLLYNAGKQIIQGLIDGIESMIGAVKSKLKTLTDMIPDLKGPPAKDKALLFGAGQMIIEGLINGITSKEDALSKKLKEVTENIKDALKTLRSDFAGLVDPIASAFTGDLFEAETAQEFVNSLMGTKGTLQGLAAAFKTLIKQGLNPKFLYGLFQSGNAGLILDLAANPALAAQAGSLFGDVNQLSNELGQAVAGATPEGKAMLGKMDRLEHKLDHLIDATKKVGSDVGREVNGAASNGHRRRRAA